MAASVASVLTQAATAATKKDPVTSSSPEVPAAPGTCEGLMQRLQEARAAKRRAKRQQRRTEKAAQGSTLDDQNEKMRQSATLSLVATVEDKRYPSTWAEAAEMAS